MADVLGTLGQSPDLMAALNDPDVRALMQDPQQPQAARRSAQAGRGPGPRCAAKPAAQAA
jgi:hypothetical protein